MHTATQPRQSTTARLRAGARAATALTACLTAALLAAPAARADDPALVVDGASKGARCSDARIPAAVSAGAPWCTLSRALTGAPAGSTVLVRSGSTYATTVLKRLRPAARVTLQAYPGETPVAAGLRLTDSSSLTVRGLVFTRMIMLTNVSDMSFTDNELRLVPNGMHTGNGFVITGARSMVFRRNWFHDGWVAILFRWGGATDVQIEDNRFERMGNAGVHLQYGNRVSIDHNDFVDGRPRADMNRFAHSDAVHSMGPSDHVSLTDNFVHGGRGFIIETSVPDAAAHPGAAQTNMVISGNVFTYPRDFAVRTYSGVPGLRLANNTAWPTAGLTTGIDMRDVRVNESPSTGLTMVNNILGNVSTGNTVTFALEDHNLIGVGLRRGAHDLTGDPRLAPSGDGTLMAASPARNAGDAAFAPSEGDATAQRTGAPDIGAPAWTPAPRARAATARRAKLRARAPRR